MSNAYLEIRAKVKGWERQFEMENQRKPVSSDIKANKDVLHMYQQYKHEKKKDQTERSTKEDKKLLATPKKQAINTVHDEKDGSDREPDDEETPLVNRIKEVFPTPSIRGKVLGLFDMEVNSPSTPQKMNPDVTASPLSKFRTPIQSNEPETPQSKRTPDYFLQRVNLFPKLNSAPKLFADKEDTIVDPQDSPLIKRRVSRAKSVVDLVREASVIQSNSSDKDDKDENEPHENAVNHHEILSSDISDDEPLESAPIIFEGGERRKPKRQVKRVIMRPIDEKQQLSTSKPTENYRRLKINNSSKNAFKRRRKG